MGMSSAWGNVNKKNIFASVSGITGKQHIFFNKENKTLAFASIEAHNPC
jgi:hypothetical protein